jgi:hypothetical protein
MHAAGYSGALHVPAHHIVSRTISTDVETNKKIAELSLRQPEPFQAMGKSSSTRRVLSGLELNAIKIKQRTFFL